MTLRIGAITIDPPTIFAPLAGISDLPMRLSAKTAGCGLVYSEMVSANALVRNQYKTLELLRSHPDEEPLTVQIFGGDGATLVEAARRVEELGAAVVDINCGCAVKKILKSGAGAALMQDPARTAQILAAVRAAIRIPLTIKLRSGWDASGAQALLLADMAQDCGVAAIALHPRTARQGFAGEADWTLIARLKARARIPIIGNGDVTSAAAALAMFTRTGCDAVMVGRAAIGYPFIFGQIADLLGGRPPRTVSDAARIDAMRRYAAASIAAHGESRACRLLRSRLAWFAKGLPQAACFRQAIRQLADRQEVEQHIAAFAAHLDPPSA